MGSVLLGYFLWKDSGALPSSLILMQVTNYHFQWLWLAEAYVNYLLAEPPRRKLWIKSEEQYQT